MKTPGDYEALIHLLMFGCVMYSIIIAIFLWDISKMVNARKKTIKTNTNDKENNNDDLQSI